ncbi:MAG: carbohydrate ABC transporter permease [Chloroflexi bacterium]|nr:carbohydrate ABC transporter permease [Chloroflexota bacterium]
MSIPARKPASTGPSANRPNLPTDYSVRVDKVTVRWQVTRVFRATASFAVAFLVLIPVIWMGMTAFKSQADAVASPPKLTFTPNLEGFVSQFWDHRDVKGEELEELRANEDDLSWQDKIMLDKEMTTTRTSDFALHLRNSLIIASTSTLLSVGFGLLAAYAFSRFNVPGEDDLLFFILSTRMLPPVVVTIPIFLMYRRIGLYDTHIGMIILYTAFNLSLSVWLLKGFIDEIPREYEEAALVDGYTRLQAFLRIVVPQAMTGIATTVVFCFIFAWNEYAFAIMLTSGDARTAPPSLPSKIGVGTTEWAAIAFGSLVFLIPVVIVTFALRQHLLRGVTFGAIRRG